MTPGLTTALIFVVMLVLLSGGMPFTFAIGGTALLFTVLLWGVDGLAIVARSTAGTMQTTYFLAIPLFILMSDFLEKSGLADDLYQLMYTSLGRIRGGLAIGTVVICTLFAAMAGISAAATVSMGLIALPSMLKRGYNKQLAIGCIAAGGALGILIPPSVSMIVLGVTASVSVGKLFAGGYLPGFMLAAMFVLYIFARTSLEPNAGPALSREERPPWRSVLVQLRSLLLPLMIIISVIGSMFSGIATPTEAAAVGALGALISATIKHRVNRRFIQDCSKETLRISTFIMWVIVASSWFSAVYNQVGGPALVTQAVQTMGANRWVIIIGMQVVLIALGMFLDTSAIILITIPVFMPIVNVLGFDPVWFGVLFIVNMEMGFLTPPYGVNLFYLRSIAPEGITMLDIYKSVVPFVFIQLVGLAICMLLPETILFLPRLIFG